MSKDSKACNQYFKINGNAIKKCIVWVLFHGNFFLL